MAGGGERLDRAVARELRRLGHDVSNRQAKAFVEDGRVSVSGSRQTRASWRLNAGERVSVEVGAAELAPEDIERVDLGEAVLYRDDFVVAINKPAGLPTHATHDPNRDHAHAAIERVLGVGHYVAVHHRLDVETSGVLLFGIHKSANKGLADAFAQRLAKKNYVALVEPPPTLDSFVVENHLGRHRHEREKMCEVRAGGDYARTVFEVAGRADTTAMVIAMPETGRRHQIRAHLSGIGAPILGDVLYGGFGDSRVMLHAARLVLPHPVTGDSLEIRAPLPEDMRRLGRDRGIDPGQGFAHE